MNMKSIIPNTHKILQHDIDKGVMTVKRPDGLKIYLSEKDDPALNQLRLFARQEVVIFAVGLYRGLQIANNYQNSHTGNNYDYFKLFKQLTAKYKNQIKGA